MTAIQFAKAEIAAGRFPNITIQAIAGSYYLGDNEWKLLKGKSFATVDVARIERSRIIERATKARLRV